MNDSADLRTLANEFRRMVAPLPVHGCYKKFHTQPQHDGSPHVEEEAGQFNFVVTERGLEIERIEGLSADDILYLLMRSVTMVMATQYELENRRPGIDGRSIWFPYQEKLMGEFNTQWAARLAAEHAKILSQHPYRA